MGQQRFDTLKQTLKFIEERFWTLNGGRFLTTCIDHEKNQRGL